MNGTELGRLIAVLAFLAPHLAGAAGETGRPKFEKVFHVAGVPGTPRDARVDLALAAESFVVEARETKLAWSVPYASIRRVRLLAGERRYPGATYAAALATQQFGGFGALLILAKHQVATLVIEYVNQRGGEMGIVFQLPRLQGSRCARLLEAHGVPVEEPEMPPAPSPAEE